MKFKVGDKVKHKDFGVGKIIGFDVLDNQYAVEFENERKDLMHNFPTTYMHAGLTKPIDRIAGYWCWDDEIELVEEAPKNLIPQIAKMLGVEIGEEFKISNIPDVYKFTEDGLIGMNRFRTYIAFIDFFKLISGKEEVIKLPKKPILTEDERVILKNIQKKYKYIARDYSGRLHIFIDKPTKHKRQWFDRTTYISMNMFDNLFQFIKWEDEEAYNIEELLKGE